MLWQILRFHSVKIQASAASQPFPAVDPAEWYPDRKSVSSDILSRLYTAFDKEDTYKKLIDDKIEEILTNDYK